MKDEWIEITQELFEEALSPILGKGEILDVRFPKKDSLQEPTVWIKFRGKE